MTEPSPPASVVHVSPGAGELAAEVASRLLARLEEVQAEDRVPSIVLTGGTIADEIHRELARLAVDSSVDWSRVDIWWGDERYVAADSADRNAGQARAAFLDQVPLAPERVHEMPALDYGDLDYAAAAYAEELRAAGSGAFDVVMLGLGPDGHVASLFPGYPQLDLTGALTTPVTDSPKPPPERISLTFDALNHTRAVWFLVSGEGKSDAVAAALAGGDLHEIPARGVQADETIWFVDEVAASAL